MRGSQHVATPYCGATVAEVGKLGDVSLGDDDLVDELLTAGRGVSHSEVSPSGQPTTTPPSGIVHQCVGAPSELVSTTGIGWPRRSSAADGSIGRAASVSDGKPVESVRRSTSSSMRPMRNHPLTTRRAGAMATTAPAITARATAATSSGRHSGRISRGAGTAATAVDDEMLADACQHDRQAIVVEPHVTHCRTPPRPARYAASPSPATAATSLCPAARRGRRPSPARRVARSGARQSRGDPLHRGG